MLDLPAIQCWSEFVTEIVLLEVLPGSLLASENY